MSHTDDGTSARRNTLFAGRSARKGHRKVWQAQIKTQRRKHPNFTALKIGLIDQLHEAIAREIAARGEQRINNDLARREALHCTPDGRRAVDEADRHLRYQATVGQCPRDPKHAFIVGARPSFAVGGNQDRSLRDGVWRAQWLVPSEKVILFHTLYLPDGRDIGIRLISVNVAAS